MTNCSIEEKMANCGYSEKQIASVKKQIDRIMLDRADKTSDCATDFFETMDEQAVTEGGNEQWSLT